MQCKKYELTFYRKDRDSFGTPEKFFFKCFNTYKSYKEIQQHEDFASRGNSEKIRAPRWDSNPRPSVI